MNWLSTAYHRLAKRIQFLLGWTSGCQMPKCSTPKTGPKYPWPALWDWHSWWLPHISPMAWAWLVAQLGANSSSSVAAVCCALLPFCHHFLLHLPLGLLCLLYRLLVIRVGGQWVGLVIPYCRPPKLRLVGQLDMLLPCCQGFSTFV